MLFDEAEKLLGMGFRVSRSTWNGSGRQIILTEDKTQKLVSEPSAIFDGAFDVKAYVPTDDDLSATDWEIERVQVQR